MPNGAIDLDKSLHRESIGLLEGPSFGPSEGSRLRESNPRPTHYEDLLGCVGESWQPAEVPEVLGFGRLAIVG